MASIIALAAAAALTQLAPASTLPEIRVLEATFVQQDLTSGTYKVFPTRRIKYVPGKSCYSWALRVEPQESEVTITERFTLPAPAEQWNNSKSHVTPDRTEAVTDFKEYLGDGLLTNGWCVAEGDPTGQYVIDVYYRGLRLHQFKFEVVEDTY